MQLFTNQRESDACRVTRDGAHASPVLRSRATAEDGRITHHASRFTFYSFRKGFTLIEVMIACGIFFMATFSILALVSSSLRQARALQQHADVDAGMAAALVTQSLKTNKLSDVSLSGDFGEAYPDYSWQAEVNEYATNGLLEVNVLVSRRGAHKPIDSLSVLVYAPDAQKSKPGAPTFR